MPIIRGLDRNRVRYIIWRMAVAGLGLFVAAHFVGAAALLVHSLVHIKGRDLAMRYWKTQISKPSRVLRLVLNDREIRLYGFGVATIIGCLAALSAMAGQPGTGRPVNSSRYGSHGSGRWATPEEVKAEFASTGPGAVLGRLPAGGHWRPVIYPWVGKAKNRFLLIIGPPGSGKTSRYTLPNLLHAARVDPSRSLVITDPKGDVYRQTAQLLQERGYAVKVFNLIHPRASDRYNPMDYVRTVEDAFRLANTVIANTSGHSVTGDAFWINAERSLLACLIWYTKTSLEPKQQHLATVLHLGGIFAKDAKFMEKVFTADGVDPAAQALYSQIGGLSDKTRDGVFIGFSVRLQLWTSQEIAALTAASDFTFRELAQSRTALFLILPDHHSTYQALTSLFFDQAFQELIAEADLNQGRLKFEVRMMLEEMANIGRIPDLEKRIATVRSRGILVEMVLQTVGQLKALYGEAWNTITGCADTILALAANDQETAEWISRRLGTATIRTTSTSSTATDRGDSSSQSFHYTSRALMLPDEVQGQGEGGLPLDQLLLIQRGLPPAKLYKYPVEEFPGYGECQASDPHLHATQRPEGPVLLPELKPQKSARKKGEAKPKTDGKSPTWLADKQKQREESH